MGNVVDATKHRPPVGLKTRGKRLWEDVLAIPGWDPNAGEIVLLEEACRAADRLEVLDRELRKGRDHPPTSLLVESRQQQQTLKLLVASLRLPDASGRRGIRRPPRGTHLPTPKDEMLSALDRARQKAQGA